ncbi:uncharacterized protein LALA0_S02e04698g [Lachancea lanzarotensis]|uniref:LALA0S02e04698g1_1 n=1 Tax=Lachancea lanzarotensis TaxID=1245769 RepID=A0A0C7MU84_9SACH|nr:uncharacterized protein LALA0_S02e04698g [Lachancea lanzarotensis]CEP61009.1 LALA0S02e04698g1_1 [Lachancea lanzarotensis]
MTVKNNKITTAFAWCSTSRKDPFYTKVDRKRDQGLVTIQKFLRVWSRMECHENRQNSFNAAQILNLETDFSSSRVWHLSAQMRIKIHTQFPEKALGPSLERSRLRILFKILHVDIQRNRPFTLATRLACCCIFSEFQIKTCSRISRTRQETDNCHPS